MSELSEIEMRLLQRCAAGHDIKDSDRANDRAKQQLKKRGYLVFERSYWGWRITPAGEQAIAPPTRSDAAD